jgi:hypothetical protein
MSVDTADDPKSIAETYFRSWGEKDFDTLRSLLADDATFRGPLGKADDGDACLQGLKAMAQIITGIDVQKMFVDGPDVLTWFELYTTEAGPMPVINWSHVEGGQITRINVLFDPRPIAPPAGL